MRRSLPLLTLVPLLLAGCASSLGPGIEPEATDVADFTRRVNILASEEFGGRAPGTPGIDLAATFIESELSAIGVRPLSGGWRLPFEVSGELLVHDASFSYAAPGVSGELTMGEQFNPLGVSGDGPAEGTLAFVGYGIEKGPEGHETYTSFPDGTDLTGKIAVLLRFEPMDEDGTSLWAEDGGWSNAAALRSKFRNVLDHDPAGIIFVAPPGVNDPRAEALPTTRSTRMGDRYDIPVVAATTEAVDRLVQLADHEGRSLEDLRRLADAGEGGVIELSGGHVRLEASMSIDQVETANIAGVIEGKGELADEWVVIGAHYDHLGLGTGATGRSRAGANTGLVHPGADDNASGVAGVLQAAEDLSRAYAMLPYDADARSILLLFFSAEEMGLLGSKAFVADGPIDSESVAAMLNMDMIGRLNRGSLEIMGSGTAEEFATMLDPYWEEHAFRVKETKSGVGPSDHASFYRAGVPVLAFHTGTHDDYHMPSDTPDTVNPHGGARVAALVTDLAYDLAVRPERLAYIETQAPQRSGPSRRSGVSLGFMPGSYDESEPGVLLGEVIPGSQAEKAGLRKGDRIVAWNGEELANVFGYMQALSAHKAGDRVILTVERAEETLEIPATLGTSDRSR